MVSKLYITVEVDVPDDLSEKDIESINGYSWRIPVKIQELQADIHNEVNKKLQSLYDDKDVRLSIEGTEISPK